MRYLPHTPVDRDAMLRSIGVASIDELFAGVPKSARLPGLLDAPGHADEMAVEAVLSALAKRNMPTGEVPSFLGAGAYHHHIPAAVDHLIQRSEFLTAYTPYQPEISQGTLQMLFEFQTQVALITGMDVANASMYDGASACAEAVLMAGRITRRNKSVLSGGLHPHYAAAIRTHVRFTAHDVVQAVPDPKGIEDLAAQIDDATACVVVQSPAFFGGLHDLRGLAAACHAKGALLVAAVTEVVSLGAVLSPGDMGADIVVAEGQSLGNPLSFGGPYLGLFATRDHFVRQMPGRLCGETVDADGRRGYVLTLSTREQHIRRERATSNICTNAGLCALAFSIHLALLGEEGFKRLAHLNHARAVELAGRLAAVVGVEVLNETFFNEFTVRLPGDAASVIDDLAARGILAGVPVSRLWPGEADLADLAIVAATELTSDADITALAGGLERVLA
jgi:glycine dehydrogenase subunit 1